ncbi:MAG: hypothetical protein OXN96_19225 [Bryobacterales bacterium]|nr:hypothetical protein [Bryobacterales bacterium]
MTAVLDFLSIAGTAALGLIALFFLGYLLCAALLYLGVFTVALKALWRRRRR